MQKNAPKEEVDKVMKDNITEELNKAKKNK